MNRRKFIKTASLSVLSSTSFMDSWMEPLDFPIIDTHQHLWDLDLFPLRWVKPPLDRSYLSEEYKEAIKGHHVVKAIYMEVGVPQEYRKKEAEWIVKVCEDPQNPTVAAVISADPSQPGFETFIRTFEGNPYIKGIRYSLQNVDKKIPDKLVDNVRLLGKMNFSMDMNLTVERMEKGIELLDQCPDVRFILNHCGNADPVAFMSSDRELPREILHDSESWYRNMEIMSQRPHVNCKISGIVDNVTNFTLSPKDLSPIIDHCFTLFGSDRVMFGGDWPVCLKNMSLGAWIDLLSEVVSRFSVIEQRKLFHDNALAFYGLKS